MSIHHPPELVVRAAPFLRTGTTTPRIMRDVVLALLPLLGMAVYLFGPVALLVVGVTTAGAMGTEAILSRRRGQLADWSAALTGLVLGLTLPPGLPLWMALLGGIVAVGLGKTIWGGLGQNLFNPALVGRAFLQAAFPTALTTWTAPHPAEGWLHIGSSTFALPLMSPIVDGFSAATPLGLQKFQGEMTGLEPLLLGTTGGSLGETGALLILAGGLFLAWRRVLDWRVPVAILVAVALFSGALHLVAPASHPPPWFMLGSGGLLFGAVFMATDPVTSPTTPRGAWIFGIGIGLLVVLIRRFGGLPEGVMYAILLMNAASPLIEKATQPRPFGRRTP